MFIFYRKAQNMNDKDFTVARDTRSLISVAHLCAPGLTVLEALRKLTESNDNEKISKQESWW